MILFPSTEIKRKREAFFSSGHFVQLESDGFQIEWHRDGWDIEIEIGPKGKIITVLVAREPE